MKILRHLVLATLSIFFLLPLAAVFSTSFKSPSEIYSNSFAWLPQNFNLDNYLEAISRIDFVTCLSNTLYIAILNILGVLLASSLAAYAFAAMQWRGRDLLFMITLSTIMLPEMVLMTPQFLLFKSFSWYGTMLPLIMPYFCGLPFYIFLLRQFFLTIPQELRAAAKIDGADEFTIWRSIYMPLAKPVLIIVALFQFLISWNDLLKPSVYLIDSSQYTLSLALQQYQSRLGGAQWGPMMAAVIMMLIPVLVLFIFGQKYFVRGITLSGLKES
jgi:multiple sugar transport system permease protein